MLEPNNNGVPRTIHLTLTRQCNIRCLYCPPDLCTPGQEMSTRQWKETIDELTRDYGRSWFVVKGGEPMLRDDLLEILAHIKSQGHAITLITNGTLIKGPDTARALETYVDQMEISLDGTSASTTDRIKGEGVFDRIMSGIALLDPSRIDLGLSFVILPENQEILYDAIEAFVHTHMGGNARIQIDNRINLPGNGRSDDLFDFLRLDPGLGCLGRHPAAEGYDIASPGRFHRFTMDNTVPVEASRTD